MINGFQPYCREVGEYRVHCNLRGVGGVCSQTIYVGCKYFSRRIYAAYIVTKRYILTRLGRPANDRQHDSPRRTRKSPAIYSPQDYESPAITGSMILYCPAGLPFPGNYWLKEQVQYCLARAEKLWQLDLLPDSRLAHD